MCVASLRSMTYAIKAKKALSAFDLEGEIIRLEPQMTHNGCAYGIKFDCVNLCSVQDALSKKHINYTEIINL